MSVFEKKNPCYSIINYDYYTALLQNIYICIYTLYTLIPEQLELKVSSSKTATVRNHKPPVGQSIHQISDSGEHSSNRSCNISV